MRRRSAILGLLLAAAACGETKTTGGAAKEEAEAEAATPGTRPPRVSAGPDTASLVPYVIFESKVETERPKRITLRIVVFSPQSAAGVTRTLRTAFDSLAVVDSQLVAARAIVYATRMRGEREADLVPVAWGVWVPPEGWEAAGPGSRARIHRTHVYFGARPDPEILGEGLEP